MRALFLILMATLTITFAGTEICGATSGADCIKLGDSEGTRLVQTETLLGDDAETYFDRDVIAGQLAVATRITKADAARALFAQLNARQATSGAGALVIEFVVDATTHRFTFARAKCEPMKGARIGVGVTLEYTFTVGQLAYTSSDAEDWAAEELAGGDFTTSPTEDEDGGHFTDNFATADVDGGTW